MTISKQLKDLLRPYWYGYKRGIIPLQKSLVKPLAFLPYDSTIIGPPRGFYLSTKDWFNLYQKNQIEASYKEIYPSQIVYRSEPKTIGERNIHWKMRSCYQHYSPTAFVAKVPNGRVIGENGSVITPDDKLLADVSVEHRRNINEHSLFTQWKLPEVHHINGTAAVLSTQGSDVYFHWMFDVLPRLELLRRSGINFDGIDKFIFSSYHSSFQVETLAALGVPSTKIIQNRQYLHIQADKLIVPSWAGSPGNMPDWVCDFLRKSFLTNSSDQKLESPRRIYISRAKATHRQMLNEAEVMNILKPLGFKTIFLESMSVAEQALLFSAADVVVAPHGAGLSNLVFCNPGTKVIEFFSPNYVETHYWALSNQVGLDYYYLVGEGKIPPDYSDPHFIWDNILLNIDSLSEMLNLAVIK